MKAKKVFLEVAKNLELRSFTCIGLGRMDCGDELDFYETLFDIGPSPGSHTFNDKYSNLEYAQPLCFDPTDEDREEVFQIRLLVLCIAQYIWDSGERFD